MTVDKEKVNLLLAKKQLTAKEFCEETGISRNRFYAILNSKRLSPKTIGRLAAALRCDATEIIETEK